MCWKERKKSFPLLRLVHTNQLLERLHFLFSEIPFFSLTFRRLSLKALVLMSWVSIQICDLDNRCIIICSCFLSFYLLFLFLSFEINLWKQIRARQDIAYCLLCLTYKISSLNFLVSFFLLLLFFILLFFKSIFFIFCCSFSISLDVSGKCLCLFSCFSSFLSYFSYLFHFWLNLFSFISISLLAKDS